ncbi:AAA family ATPase, partial [Vibrio paracholerae]|nr:AAA family ATPase [Vibrio paracholerae]
SSGANSNTSMKGKSSKNKEKSTVIKPNSWDELPSDDLRFIKSQCKNSTDVHTALNKQGMLLDLSSVLNLAG